MLDVLTAARNLIAARDAYDARYAEKMPPGRTPKVKQELTALAIAWRELREAVAGEESWTLAEVANGETDQF